MSQNETEMMTQHSMLVVWGLYAQAFGLIPELLKVTIQQKTVDHSPQSKILEFFLVILAGLTHLQELDTAAEPIVRDPAVARAWQQTSWAHHSGVSRTLKALTQAEAEQIVQVLDRLEQPMIDREVMLALATQGEIILDGDLTPRPVSATSRNYPDVAFGHTQGDQFGLGYQSAQVTFRSPTFQRLLLSSVLHPGDVVSNTQTTWSGQLKLAWECILGDERTYSASGSTGRSNTVRPERSVWLKLSRRWSKFWVR